MLKKIEISGFKSFAKKTTLSFDTPVTAIVGPNGSGKSNVVESVRFVLGEQSMKSLRGKGGTDLIWKGSKMLPAGSKARVAITFDNANRQFAFSNSAGASAELNFDEVTLTREVTAAGSDYFINGTSVRLKDITELLGSVNIGSSGHHIISQGEADRLLSASSKDRRSMIEDALGLKVFQTRIKESERKLEKTAANMKEVAALRRELAPHLSFLGKQVEKIQAAQELRTEFAELFNHYSKEESGVLAHAGAANRAEHEKLSRELADAERAIIPDSGHTYGPERGEAHATLRAIESEQQAFSRERDELSRAIGRIEGKLDALSVMTAPSQGATSVSVARIESLSSELISMIEDAHDRQELSEVKGALSRMREKLQQFAQSLKGEAPQPVDNAELKAGIEAERAALEERLKQIESNIREAHERINAVRRELSAIEEKAREAERVSYASRTRSVSIEGHLRENALKKEALERRALVLAEEIREAAALVGGLIQVADHHDHVEDTPEKNIERESLHRKIERIKIKLEDTGAASGTEVLKEFEETKARDAFLMRELGDLEASIASLRALISELRDTIERTFKEGIEKINVQFGEFFKLMFGGGSAFLSIVVEHRRSRDGIDDDEGEDALPFEHGIEINVSLPHKKVRDLGMFSGGERSLVSIALLFAMSQVNPPPFLVLDETDAALDEANSRRYGDMLETLSHHSKLVVVTHNRETMSRAQVLYGVTMGLDGASKLLSIKFEEAAQMAK